MVLNIKLYITKKLIFKNLNCLIGSDNFKVELNNSFVNNGQK